MKKTIFIISLLLGGIVFENATAQIPVTIRTNISAQPVWGPVGYNYVEYYYIPGIDAFYSVPTRQYIYQQNGSWMFTPALPARLSNYNLYSGYKVVVNDPEPYRNAATYRVKYAAYKGRHDQKIIRNSSDSKYFVNKDHPQHNKAKKDNHHHNR